MYNNLSLSELFERQVLASPHHIAVSHPNVTMTYQQLNTKANQLAYWLRQQDIKPKDFVALLLEPGVEFIICILAIIKVGAVYVPLDILAPNERLQEILDDAVPRLLITQKKYSSSRGIEKGVIVLMSDLQQKISHLPAYNFLHIGSDHDPAYMLYTSGSTGKPKGILIPHCAVVNLVKTFNYFFIDNSSIVAQFINLAFDPSVLEIWSVLLNGASLAIVPLHARRNYFRLKDFLLKNDVSHLVLPTGYFHQLIQFSPEILDNIRILIFGGEAINPCLVHNFFVNREKRGLPITLINAYGPTEATVASCRYMIDEKSISDMEQLSSIGKPIENVKIYILNENGQEVSRGQIGELCISGINLALGYHRNDQANKEKFIMNFFDHENSFFQRLYKTGDLVRQLPNGDLLYVGRIDDQVKVQGFRVHLCEIESQLLLHPAIRSAAVVAKKDASEHTRLIAYLVIFSEKSGITSEEITKYLAQRLPFYMLPIQYLRVPVLPLSNMGKIDKNQLCKLEAIDLMKTVTQPVHEVEKRMTAIWSKLLHVDCVDVNKNLFDLGANSLLLIEACHKISKEFHLNCSPGVVITYPSIRKLSNYFKEKLQK